MNDPTIRLQFPNLKAAYDAFDTFQELGYRPIISNQGGCQEVLIHIERNDVQSALEITHTLGGHLLENGASQPQRFEFDPDPIHIPAHVVNEDLTDGYVDGTSNAYLGDEYDTVLEGFRDSLH